MIPTRIIAIAFISLFSITSVQAKTFHHTAKHHKQLIHRGQSLELMAYGACDDRYPALCNPQAFKTSHRATVGHYAASEITFIPSPSGCHRVYVSCACRLAAYWGLGDGLDKVSTWPHVYARASGPGIGIAAVRRDQHHIMGIVGGGPGAWQVVDFNSGGHLNRTYTVANFSGYFFLDTRSKLASR